ncbi:hypothetical protein [Flavobacterium sp.]|uniref:hypothetical protein n=1 Tax=Flavobacterium sp. TaxID=239 RepID=UPI002637E7EA|nr:hypothetical protein [Flavobacterium sp.]
MKKIVLLLLTLFSCISYSQISEGQYFCDETKDGSYFPLSIDKKKILWFSTFYLETKTETKIINGKTYIEYKQDWDKSNSSLMYLREENGVIYEYDSEEKNEDVRYDPKFEKGHQWKTADGKSEYEIIAFDGKLKTPYCDYKDLLVIHAKMGYGEYNFYYFKGHGYIGATKNDKLISCVTPKW